MKDTDSWRFKTRSSEEYLKTNKEICYTIYANKILSRKSETANPSGSAVQDTGLRPIACWDCGFESFRGHVFLSLASIVCCLWVGLITSPEEFYPVWCDWVWPWILDNKEALAHHGCCAMVKKNLKEYLGVDGAMTEVCTGVKWPQ